MGEEVARFYFSVGLLLCGCTAKSPSEPDPVDCKNSFESHHHHHHHEDTGHGTLPSRESMLPEVLSEAGLYSDIASKKVHSAVKAFAPRYELWSDGADKKRWAYVPECESIDSSDMNDWQFPVGTRFFKEFTVDGRRIETRLIERIGIGPRDFAYASYQWNDAETEATRVAEDGVLGAKGTSHDIPSKSQCLNCHGTHARGGGRPSRALGFSALQLSHSGAGLKLSDVASQLSQAPSGSYQVPGDGVAKAALGYMHANCGNCHNGTKDRVPQTSLNLWLDVGLTSVEETAAYQTAVGQATRTFVDQHVTGRIVPGSPDESAVYYRMNQRGNNAQMPPMATHQLDPDGLAAVRQWIEALP